MKRSIDTDSQPTSSGLLLGSEPLTDVQDRRLAATGEPGLPGDDDDKDGDAEDSDGEDSDATDGGDTEDAKDADGKD